MLGTLARTAVPRLQFPLAWACTAPRDSPHAGPWPAPAYDAAMHTPALLEELSTSSLPPDAVPERLALWGDAVWRLLGGLHCDTFGDPRFDGRIVACDAGALTLCQLEVSRHRVVRTPAQARASDHGWVKVVAQLEGRACFEQDGRQVWLSPGEWSLYDTTRPYSVSNLEPIRQLVVLVPKRRLQADRLPLPALTVRRFTASRGVARLAWETMRTTFDERPALAAPAADGAGDVIAQLLHLALLERSERPSMLTQREALRDRAKAHIERHLADPRLGPATIAAALNCSVRHLYNALGDEAGGVAGYVLQQRLAVVQQALREPRRRHEAVASIARDCGFGNAAHFSRVFRRHVGVSPTAWREDTAG